MLPITVIIEFTADSFTAQKLRALGLNIQPARANGHLPTYVLTLEPKDLPWLIALSDKLIEIRLKHLAEVEKKSACPALYFPRG